MYQPFKAIVKRGYITRMLNEEQFESELVRLPNSQQTQDADAIPHYVKTDSGMYVEYYGFDPSTDERPIYVPVDFV